MLSYSGGVIQSVGIRQGNESPTLAALFNHLGAGRPVSFWQRYEVKWLQLFVRRL
jgi:hypothetical protein